MITSMIDERERGHPSRGGGVSAVTAAQPRPAVRGYHWTTGEEAVLQQHYSIAGPARCAELLPHRGLHSVYAKAQKLGLAAPAALSRTEGKRFARKYPKTPEIDTAITDAYRNAVHKRGDIKRLALQVDRPKWWVCKRAAELGLTIERIKPLEWSFAEDAILAEYAKCDFKTISMRLRRAGFSRSVTAVAVRMKRQKLDRFDPDSWNARELGPLLGVDPRTVADWIDRRGLKASRKNGDSDRGTFRVTRASLRAWLREHHGYVDLRRVDQPWFWGVVL